MKASDKLILLYLAVCCFNKSVSGEIEPLGTTEINKLKTKRYQCIICNETQPLKNFSLSRCDHATCKECVKDRRIQKKCHTCRQVNPSWYKPFPKNLQLKEPEDPHEKCFASLGRAVFMGSFVACFYGLMAFRYGLLPKWIYGYEDDYNPKNI